MAYNQLQGLALSDMVGPEDMLTVDLLVGADHYWRVVTGQMRRGRAGPIAVETKIGWILSGPVDLQVQPILLCAIHTLCSLKPTLLEKNASMTNSDVSES